jgi:hypothetical protein
VSPLLSATEIHTDQDQLTPLSKVLVIFSLGGKKEGPGASVQVTKNIVSNFAEYYPDVLGFAVLMQIPWYMRAFLSVILPFVDPHTRAKIR